MNVIIDQPERYESFYQGNTGHAIVLLPGLCGSELELGPIPRLLRQANHTYTIPRIPGYSAHTGLTGYKDWIDTVDQLISDLGISHQSVSLVGLSMGATLALASASRNNTIRSLVLLSPVLLFDGWSVPWYYPLLSMVYRVGIRNWHYKESEPFGVKNRELRKHIKKAVTSNEVSALGAAHLPSRHLFESLQLISHTKRYLSDVTSDTLIIHAIDDDTASPKTPEMIQEAIHSETIRMIWLGNSYHIITVDNEREIVANEVNNFIAQSIAKPEMVARLNADIPRLIIKNRSES